MFGFVRVMVCVFVLVHHVTFCMWSCLLTCKEKIWDAKQRTSYSGGTTCEQNMSSTNKLSVTYDMTISVCTMNSYVPEKKNI